MDSEFDVLIVGAGLSGVGAACHLRRRLPHKRFAILESREAIGGTWDLFRYPGVRSDSDMFTLGYAFAPWRHDRSIVGGEAILGYLDEVIASRDLREHMRFGLTAIAADWDSHAGLWTVRMQDDTGASHAVVARFLFLGSGYYDYDAPHDAEIPGLDRFDGVIVHPQLWSEDIDYSGKNI